MQNDSDTPVASGDERRLRVQLWVSVMVWTLFVMSLLLWSQRNIETEMMGLARQEAVANFNKDQAFRIWGTQHGGVYVPVSERTQASPYLAHIPERDLVTPSGRQLTLLNPAYMLRQMMEDFDELYGVKGRITSLKPLNPDNAPDDWERSALKAFENGEKERFEVTEINGEPFLRLIRPMMTREGCLVCHRHQGYQVGDVRGGVGISVPLESYFNVAAGRKQNLWVILSVVWFVGMGVIGVGGRLGQQRIRERMDYEGRIWRQANFDTLTDLSNRNLFMDRLERAMAYARRDGHPLALLFIDLDRFKDVNDTQGHETGDKLLQLAAQRLQDCVREVDTVSRLGGDEFTVILAEIDDGINAKTVAENILLQLACPFDLEGLEAHISASIGITVFPQDGDDPGTLLKNADTAMYQAKTDGRNTYRYFTIDMNRKAEQRVTVESELRLALKQDEFELFYQPVVKMSDGCLSGAEALIRWNSPERGVVEPGEFIPVAEDSRLIVPMGDWVIQRAITDLTRWQRAGLFLPRLSVNVSTVQFRNSGFAEKIQILLDREGGLNSRFIIEITESVFMDKYGQAGRDLEKLRERGIGVAIDDFGTGYSSLSYLKRFPVDIIKIDRSFVRDVTRDPEDAALCEAIIAMAHRLDMRVIAEGVESEQQWQFLRDNECDYAQGYLFGRPMPATQFTEYMQAELSRVEDVVS